MISLYEKFNDVLKKEPCDIKILLDWIEDYALWFDPEGYWDVMETIEYLRSELIND